MKKIGQICRELTANHIKDSLNSSEGFFVVRNVGLSSNEFNLLRGNLRKSNAKLFLTKNSVTRFLLKEKKAETLVKLFEGPSAIIFVRDDIVAAAKVLHTFSQEHKNLELVGGFCEDKLLEKTDLLTLAKLPTKDILRAQVVYALAAPLSALVGVLNNSIAKLVWVLDAIIKKKGD